MKTRFRELFPTKFNKKRFWFQLVGLILLVGSAVAATWFVQACVMGHGFSPYLALDFFKLGYVPFLFGFLVTLLTGLLISAIAGSLYIGTGVNFIIYVALGYGSLLKMNARGEPIYPTELSMVGNAGDLMSMINKKQLALVVAALVVLLAIFIGAHFLLKRWLKLGHQGQRSYIFRLLALIPLLIVLHSFVMIGSQQTLVRRYASARGYYNYQWNQRQSYQKNGFMMGFLFNATAPKMSAPAGYSEAAVTKIVKKYQAEATKQNQTTTTLPKGTNVNVVLNESLTNLDYPDIQKYFSFSQDPQPFLNSLGSKSNAVVGNFVSDQYGGGTANVEYEVITGMSNYFLSESAYQSVVPYTSSYPSVANYYKGKGYSVTALHSYNGDMYKRSENYPKLGIDTFLTVNKLKNLKPNPFGIYTTDQSLYNNLYTQWRKNATTGNGQFNLTLTMQNHMPYINNANVKNVNALKKIKVTAKSALKGVDKGTYNQLFLENYVNSVNETDKAMKNLYAHIQKQKKPTIVVLFGDHRPGTMIDFLRDKNALQGHMTPVVYMANFDLKKYNLKDMSPNFAVADMYKVANMKRTGFTQLLLDLQKKVPVLTQAVSKLGDGSKATKSKLAKIQTYKDYQMINYDLNSGKKYATAAGFYK